VSLLKKCWITLPKLERNMLNGSKQFRVFAERIRYSEDRVHGTPIITFPDFSDIYDHSLRNGLLVGTVTTPKLEDVVEKCCERLRFPREKVSVFVFASPHIQATCQSTSEHDCIIQVSSGLMNLLSNDEVMFVIGHELGHHSLQHYLTHVQQESLERQMQQRAQEISVDRLGLVACQNLNTAASAMIKTLSGLNEAHLGSDIRGFLDQAKALRKPISGENARNSHPSLLMRCRALLWFSNVYTETDIASKNFSEHMLKVNQRVKDDFEKFVEAPSINFLKGVARNLGMWIAANKIILKGVFSKSDQAAFSSLYGKDNLHKFKRLLESSSKKEVVVFIEKKVEENNRHLKSLVPSSFEGHRRSIINEIDKAF